MIALKSGERMLPGRVILAEGLALTYQTDGNFVIYDQSPIVPLWATMTLGSPGFVEMQVDGNLVIYNSDGVPIWATNTFVAGSVLEFDKNGIRVSILTPTVIWRQDVVDIEPPEPPIPPTSIIQLNGEVLPERKSFRDATGPRRYAGCTDFGGVVKHHENRDASLRSLDITAACWHYIRVAYRLNGWLWTPSGLTIDPIRDVWWDSELFNFLAACHERGLRVDLTCADMFNWSDGQAQDAIETVAEIARNFGDTVILHEWNEMRGTCPGGENDVHKLEQLTGRYQAIYGRNLRGISDPASQDKAGCHKLSRSPANTALVHNVRWYIADATRRAFNMGYENRPDDRPVKEGEPTGPNGAHPGGLYGGHVWQPTENHDDLLAIATINILAGIPFTYFNDPALVSRMPLDSTWGFKEIQPLWNSMEIPENVGQGTLLHGGRPEAPIKVISSNPNRADSVTCPNGWVYGMVFDTFLCNKSGTLTAYRSGGVTLERQVNVGEVVSVGEPNHPTTVRIR